MDIKKHNLWVCDGKYYDINFNEVVTIHNVSIFGSNNFKTMIKEYEMSSHTPWREDNISGKWMVTQNWSNAKWSIIYSFESEEDATAFKLRWS